MSHRFTSRLVLFVASVLCAGWTLAAMPQGATEVVEVAVEVTSVSAERAEADPLDVAPVAAVTDDPFAASAECDESEPLDFTPAVTDDASASDTAARCKKCQDRPWCHCSYNGLPRVSCNPCCYGNLGIPQVCLD